MYVQKYCPPYIPPANMCSRSVSYRSHPKKTCSSFSCYGSPAGNVCRRATPYIVYHPRQTCAADLSRADHSRKTGVAHVALADHPREMCAGVLSPVQIPPRERCAEERLLFLFFSYGELLLVYGTARLCCRKAQQARLKLSLLFGAGGSGGISFVSDGKPLLVAR